MLSFDVFSHQGALQKRKELERSASEGKTEQSVLQRATQRTDVVSYTLLAEVSHFHQLRIRDYNRAIKIFLQEQINYYQKVIGFVPNFHLAESKWLVHSNFYRSSITSSRLCLSIKMIDRSSRLSSSFGYSLFPLFQLRVLLSLSFSSLLLFQHQFP